MMSKLSNSSVGWRSAPPEHKHMKMGDVTGPWPGEKSMEKELRSKCLTSVCVQSQQSVQNNWELKIRILRIRLASFTTKITIISKET